MRLSQATLQGALNIGTPQYSAITGVGIPMAEPNREEFLARLETVEARAETRFVELSAKIDRVADLVATGNSALVVARSEFKNELDSVRADSKFTRWTIIIAIVTSILAGLAALWVTQSNLLAAFQINLALHQTAPTPEQPKK